jgi:glycosyltransferase involved in cell wall biosynthesis
MIGKLRRLISLGKSVLRDDPRAGLSREIKLLREELEALKSSLDVPPELIDEFHAWKAANPIPAEPLVSVTVVTYNRARLLTERCLPSILGQTYKKLELIVVGDGCTDETEALLSRIKDPRLKFYNMPERGTYPVNELHRWMVAGMHAVAKTYEMIGGDYLTHLDDDDEYVLDRLEKLVDFAVKNRCDFVWHPFWREMEDGRWVLNEAREIAHGQITNASVFYRSWFTKVGPNFNSHRLMEPGDWNRYRRIKYIGPAAMRYPEPLLKHYRERNQPAGRLADNSGAAPS